MFLGYRHIPFRTTMDRGMLIPASQRTFTLHLVLSLHRSGITTRPTSLCAFSMMTEEYHTSEFHNLNYKLQRRLFDVLPIQQSHDTISFLALGRLHEDKLCVTLQEAMTPANVKRFMKPPYSISRTTSIESDCVCRYTTSVPSTKAVKTRSNQFLKATLQY